MERNARLAFDLEWRHPRQQSEDILRGLRDLLDLEVEPRRIECFDISNIQGADVVASMVVFEDARPRKSDYRKFRVRGLGGTPDDFAAMREVVSRRYRRVLEEGGEMPDLILIDGGKGQLGAATAALEELGLGHQPVASLAKREELIFLPSREEPLALPHSSPVLQLVQRVRDEAHRCAPCARSWTTSPAWARRGGGSCSHASAPSAACAAPPWKSCRPRWAPAPPRGSGPGSRRADWALLRDRPLALQLHHDQLERLVASVLRQVLATVAPCRGAGLDRGIHRLAVGQGDFLQAQHEIVVLA